MGNKRDVDTRTFRRAVWYYIHALFGIRHDDYNYSVITQLLEPSFMSYIKLVTFFPERVTSAHYHAFAKDLKPSEKVNVPIPAISSNPWVRLYEPEIFQIENLLLSFW
jgi:PA26 p53-induced protein (sestrin)